MQPTDKITKYTREVLEGYINQYLDALAENDPGGLSLDENVRFVENNQELKIGDGSWQTITGLGLYRHYYADLDTGQTAVICVVEENGKKIILNLRLLMSDDKITEIETLLVRDYRGAETYESIGGPVPVFLDQVPVEQRKPRESLIATANLYFSGMEYNDPNGDYSFFADNCDRMEHGRKTTNAEPTEYGHSTDRDFVTMSCREQFETGFLGFVTRIRDRRFFIVDEERQTVIAFALYDHNGTVRKIEMPTGSTFVLPPFFSTPRTLEVCESFRVENDRLRQIEVTMTELPYGTRPVWDREADDWLRQPEPYSFDPRSGDSPVDRDALTATLNNFLSALVSRKTESMGKIESVKYTENGQQLNIGDGLWQTATEIGDYRIILADPGSGAVAFFGTIKEYNVDGLLAARLKVLNNRIVEIEALVARHEFMDARGGTLTMFGPHPEGMFNPSDFIKAPDVFGQVIPEEKRADTEKLQAVVQNRQREIRECHTLVADAEYGLILEMTFEDILNSHKDKIDPAYTGSYTIMRIFLHKVEGDSIVLSESAFFPVPYRMSRGW